MVHNEWLKELKVGDHVLVEDPNVSTAHHVAHRRHYEGEVIEITKLHLKVVSHICGEEQFTIADGRQTNRIHAKGLIKPTIETIRKLNEVLQRNYLIYLIGRLQQGIIEGTLRMEDGWKMSENPAKAVDHLFRILTSLDNYFPIAQFGISDPILFEADRFLPQLNNYD